MSHTKIDELKPNDVAMHTRFMNKAMNEARKALDADEVPIGCVIVDPHGTIIARAHNQIERKQTQTAHAELLALAKAGKKYGWRLDDCSIYITLEPCSMCMSAISLSRISNLIYGAPSPVFGFQLDKGNKSGVYHVPMNIISGIGSDEARQMLKIFFKMKRSNPREQPK